MWKNNNERFIELSIKKHGKQYDYSKVKYANSKEKVCIICKKHGEFFIEPNAHIQGRGCPFCGNSKKGRSHNGIPYEFISFIKEFKQKCIINHIIENEKIDLYLPERKIAFVFVTFKTYSEEKNKNKKLLYNKTEICERNDIQLINIFEDEWYNKTDICKSRITNILGKSIRVYARKCNIINVSKSNARDFFNENHIQGNVNSSYIYGLEYNGELISIMSFGGLRKNMGRKNIENTFELLRFCNKKDYTVIGAASKLLKHFIIQNNPSKIISYADRRWSIGNLYTKLGFTFSHTSEPNYFYLINGVRKNRFAYRKDILISKFGCSPEKTEHNFCLEKQWYRLYDSGTKVYVWNNLI